MGSKPPSDFERMAAEGGGANVFQEMWEFLRYNKKYWLLPILLFLMLLAGFIVLSSTAAAPFIYAIF
jgi:hypothetical protein